MERRADEGANALKMRAPNEQNESRPACLDGTRMNPLSGPVATGWTGAHLPAGTVERAPVFMLYQTLRVTPAMEAGLTDRVWEITEIVALLRDETSKKAA